MRITELSFTLLRTIRMKLFRCAVFLLLGTSSLLAQSGKPIRVSSGAGTVEMVTSGSGSPAVVFESGFSDTYEYWDAVVAVLSSKTKTVRYNRAGLGHSPLNERP